MHLNCRAQESLDGFDDKSNIVYGNHVTVPTKNNAGKKDGSHICAILLQQHTVKRLIKAPQKNQYFFGAQNNRTDKNTSA